MESTLDLEDEKQRRLFEQILSAAIERWLDKQYAAVGKWTIRGVAATAVAAIAFLWYHSGGFKL